MATETMPLRELTVRYTVKRDDDGRPVPIGRVVSAPRDAAATLLALLQHEPSEVFGVLLLSSRHHVLAYHEVARGTLDSVTVAPREVFRAAILANAAGVILCHSHPSGDPTPSADDLATTHRLTTAGKLLGITVFDHLIIGAGRVVSLADLGLVSRT